MKVATGPNQPEPSIVRLVRRLRFSENTATILLACFVGVIGGYGAIAFRLLISNANKLFLWCATLLHSTLDGMAGAFASLAALPWYFKVSVPAFGGLIVGLIVYLWASEVKGHGVPEVMEAVALKRGRIRVRIVLFKALASAVSIASGGSVGREGPIVHIGSAMGSSLGQFLKVSDEKMKVLVGCGAAAGIAATFNAPIAGAIFALEIILGDFTASTFAPIVLSSTIATVISRIHLGNYPAFVNLAYEMKSAWEMGPYLTLGILTGVAASLYIFLLYKTEDLFEKAKVPSLLKPVIGGALVGCIGIYLPQVFGVGYHTVDQVLSTSFPLALLGALFLAKLLATSITLGSGGSGGIFAPSLFMGAMLGGAFGKVVNLVMPNVSAESGAYALVGMGAMVAGATHAPITSILILFEMTGDYHIIVPLMLSCITATTIARLVRKDSIYTLKLSRRGVSIHAGREETIMKSMHVWEVMRSDVTPIRRDAPFKSIVDMVLSSNETSFFVVNPDDTLAGVISIHNVKDILQEKGLEELVVADDIMTTGVPSVTPSDTLADTMRKFSARYQDVLPVVGSQENKRFLGVLHRSDIINAYNREILKQSALGIRFVSGREKERRTDYVDLPSDYATKEIPVPQSFVGKSLKELNLRAKYGVHVLAIRKGAIANVEGDQIPSPEAKLEAGDRIVIVGKTSDIEKLPDR